MASHSISGNAQGGFTYLGALIAVAIMGIGLLAASEVWTTTAHRQKLAQLDWVGEQYVQAIASYYYANTGSVHYYPTTLDDLLVDKRHLNVVRHLRTTYPNPFDGKTAWKIIPAPEGGIKGIEFKQDDADYPVSKQYVFVPPALTP